MKKVTESWKEGWRRFVSNALCPNNARREELEKLFGEIERMKLCYPKFGEDDGDYISGEAHFKEHTIKKLKTIIKDYE